MSAALSPALIGQILLGHSYTLDNMVEMEKANQHLHKLPHLYKKHELLFYRIFLHNMDLTSPILTRRPTSWEPPQCSPPTATARTPLLRESSQRPLRR